MKKFIVIFCLFVLFFQFFQIIYSQRAVFKQNYDLTYWKDRFEHSQWALPLSKRIIGDDGLFAYIGQDLINGGSITGFDAEVPPLGKYFIGLSIKIFNNPFYYAIFFGIGSLIIFYLISVRVLGDKIKALIPVSILFLDPLFFSQFWKSMLDICQLFFLLMNVLSIILLIDAKKNKFLLSCVAGISLGFFAQVKYPMLLPTILFLETIFFFLKKLKREYFFFLITLFAAILFCNFSFFLNGGTLIEFFKFQKYIFTFYTKSQLAVQNDAIWSTLFLGKFPEINGSKLVSIEEWWIMWPLMGILFILTGMNEMLKKNFSIWKGFILFVLLSFLTYTLLPSYPRYLAIVLPFMYLFAVYVLFKFKIANLIFVIIILYGLFNARVFLVDNPNKILNNFYYNFSHQYFQDIYQENINKMQIDRNEFRLVSQKTLNDAQVKAIEIKELSRNFCKGKGTVKLSIKYFTQNLGSFSETKDIKLSKIDDKWKIDWDWDLILDGFSLNSTVETQRILGKRGAIVDSSGKVLAQDYEGYIISVNPEKIDLKREPEMLEFISILGDVKAPHLQNAYLENSLPGTYIPLVSMFKPLDSEDRAKILSFPGVQLAPYGSRIYKDLDPLTIKNTLFEECCTRIYSKNYHGIAGLEKEYDLLLSGSDGGKIVIKDMEGNIIKTVVEKEAKTGQDVALQL